MWCRWRLDREMRTSSLIDGDNIRERAAGIDRNA